MAQKIILFLSDLKKDAPEKKYKCPDGSEVTGTLTNDAPVSYLLKAHKEIREIICIVTNLARETAWKHFEDVVREISSDVRLTPVSCEETQDFSETVIPAILEYVDVNDEIFLDVTGGFRNANMYLLLLSRVLSYKGIKPAGAVYGNLVTGAVEDVTPLIDMFELVGGMQEMTSFGSVKTLRAYYDKLYKSGRPKDEKILNLLTAMERLTETITLCNTSAIDGRLEKFNKAMSEAETCSDPLMKALLPVFQNKYGRKLTTTELIKWCVENGMVQQALTIYKERIPTYLLHNRKDLIDFPDFADDKEEKNSYINKDERLLENYLLSLGTTKKTKRMRDDAEMNGDKKKKKAVVITLEYLDEEMLEDCNFSVKCSVDKLRQILMDYEYIRALRNRTHHAGNATLDEQKEVERFLTERDYKRLEEVGLEDVKRALLKGLDNMKNDEGKGKKK